MSAGSGAVHSKNFPEIWTCRAEQISVKAGAGAVHSKNFPEIWTSPAEQISVTAGIIALHSKNFPERWTSQAGKLSVPAGGIAVPWKISPLTCSIIGLPEPLMLAALITHGTAAHRSPQHQLRTS